MFIARNKAGKEICARCGAETVLTKDHFIPKCCRMNVNADGNYVAICEWCNKEKADKIVLPSWYRYLKQEQQKNLCRYMRYARSFVLEHTNEQEIIEFVQKLKSEN